MASAVLRDYMMFGHHHPALASHGVSFTLLLSPLIEADEAPIGCIKKTKKKEQGREDSPPSPKVLLQHGQTE